MQAGRLCPLEARGVTTLYREGQVQGRREWPQASTSTLEGLHGSRIGGPVHVPLHLPLGARLLQLLLSRRGKRSLLPTSIGGTRRFDPQLDTRRMREMQSVRARDPPECHGSTMGGAGGGTALTPLRRLAFTCISRVTSYSARSPPASPIRTRADAGNGLYHCTSMGCGLQGVESYAN